MLSVKNCFIRGSVVRYVQLPVDDVDVTLLQDAARKEASKVIVTMMEMYSRSKKKNPILLHKNKIIARRPDKNE